MAITHSFVSGIADGSNATLVRPSNWNANHTIADGTFVRTATLIVAANNSSDKEKDQADYVCDGTNDEVELLASIADLPVKRKHKVVWLPGLYMLGAQLVIPPLQEFVIEARGATLAVKGVKFNSLLDCDITLGILAGRTNGVALEFAPEDDTAGGITVNSVNHIKIGSIAGLTSYAAGSIGIYFNPTSGAHHRISLDLLEVWGFETLIKLGSSATYSINDNIIKALYLYKGDVALLQGASGGTKNLRNRFILGLYTNLTTGVSTYAYDDYYDIYDSGGLGASAVVFQSGARRNRVFSSSGLSYTDNSGRTDNQVITETIGIKEFYTPCTNGTEAVAYDRYTGYKIDADAEVAYVTVRIPNDFQRLVSASLAYIAYSAVTDMVITVDTRFGADDEGFQTNGDTASIIKTTTANDLYEGDISGALTSIAAGDIVGFHIRRQTSGNSNILALGIRIKYQVT